MRKLNFFGSMCLRSHHVTALSFALSHLVHSPCFLYPTAVAKRLTSSRWWISSDTIFLPFNVDSLGHQRCGCSFSICHSVNYFFFILRSQQLFLPSIPDRYSQKAGHSSPVGRESHAAFGRVALFLIYNPEQATTLEVLVLLMNYIVPRLLRS